MQNSYEQNQNMKKKDLKKPKLNYFQALVIAFAMLMVLEACSKKTTTDDSTEVSEDKVSEVVDAVVGEAAGSAGSVEGGAVSLQSVVDVAGGELLPQATCSYTTARSTCASSSATVNWAGCSIGTATLTGSILESYSGTGASLCLLSGSTSVLTRTIDSANPRILTLLTGATYTTDMSPGVAYDGTTFPTAASGTVISRIESGASNGQTCSPSAPCYTVVLGGLHRVLKSAKGTKFLEHIVTSNLTTVGSRSAGTRTVSGSMTVWHQLASYRAVNTFSTVVWGSSTCCYPTSGSITSALTGSLTGTTLTVFTTTCGKANFTGIDAVTSEITLRQCQ